LQVTFVPDRLQQSATGDIARYECGTSLATDEQSIAGVDTQTAFLLFVTVTADTPFDEDRTNFRLEQTHPVIGDNGRAGEPTK
jgi:hypothetical protein